MGRNAQRRREHRHRGESGHHAWRRLARPLVVDAGADYVTFAYDPTNPHDIERQERLAAEARRAGALVDLDDTERSTDA